MKPDLSSLARIKETLSGASLEIHWWNPARACSTTEHATIADALALGNARRVRGRKTIIDTKTPTFAALTALRTAIRAGWEFRTLDYCVRGQRLFLRKRREEIWDWAAEQQSQAVDLACAMQQDRHAILATAEEDLGDCFDASLYPEDFGKEFAIEIAEHSIDPPSYLQHTNAEEYQRELQKGLYAIGASMQAFESQCFAQMGEAAQRLVANLSGGRVMSANLDAFGKVFNRIGQMSFEGTAIFKDATAEAQAILDGVDVAELRKPGGVREETREKLQSLLARYQQLQEKVTEKHAEVA
jgi:hypothetical protein